MANASPLRFATWWVKGDFRLGDAVGRSDSVKLWEFRGFRLR